MLNTRFMLTVAIIASLALPVRSQWDTALCRSLPPAIAGTALIGAGSLFTFQPRMTEWQVSLRDNVVQQDMPRLHFDDYIQYVPLLSPWVLNLCGVEGRHKLDRLVLLEGGSYLLGAGWLNATKYGLAVMRPDNSTANSFPSGHTFTAFVGAEILRREYGEEYPWVAVAGYAAATVVGLMRIYNNRHWAGDVLAGAGLGILSVSLVYWVLD